MKVILKAIAQMTPNRAGIEAPSRIENPIAISSEQFANEYADSAKAGQVSLDPDGVSNPQPITTYTGGNPMKGRFIVKGG
jgi:hypothetical protein